MGMYRTRLILTITISEKISYPDSSATAKRQPKKIIIVKISFVRVDSEQLRPQNDLTWHYVFDAPLLSIQTAVLAAVQYQKKEIKARNVFAIAHLINTRLVVKVDK